MKSKTLVSISVAIVWFAAASLLHAADPVLGTWKLNVAKSKFSPGPGPKSSTVTYEAVGDAVKRTGEGIAADGKKTGFSYTAKFDGKDYPVTGSENLDAISIKKIDDHSTESTLKRAGKAVASAKRTISKDGKVMTITTTGTNAKGEKFNTVAVYDKQ